MMMLREQLLLLQECQGEINISHKNLEETTLLMVISPFTMPLQMEQSLDDQEDTISWESREGKSMETHSKETPNWGTKQILPLLTVWQGTYSWLSRPLQMLLA